MSADQSEVDFMALMSHELSTPLTSVRWNAELLRSAKITNPLDPGQTQLADEIIAGAKRMGDLVSDIHEASWLERNKFADEPTSTFLNELVTKVQAEQQKLIDSKKLTLSIESEPDLPAITARPSTLLLLVQNLLSNAVKYTADSGSVRVTLRLATADELAKIPQTGQSAISMSITDTGYGIPAEQQDQVFQKFFRGDNVRPLGIEGTGLGTYIISMAVASVQGAVWFESTEGQGTTFSVVLPLSTTPVEA